jgi:hypothetical protein
VSSVLIFNAISYSKESVNFVWAVQDDDRFITFVFAPFFFQIPEPWKPMAMPVQDNHYQLLDVLLRAYDGYAILFNTALLHSSPVSKYRLMLVSQQHSHYDYEIQGFRQMNGVNLNLKLRS